MVEEILEKKINEIKKNITLKSKGRIIASQEHYFISNGPVSKIGDLCEVGEDKILCEVMSVKKNEVTLFPLVNEGKVKVKDWVSNISQELKIPADEELLGSVLNALGETINGEDRKTNQKISLEGKINNAFERRKIENVFETGVKSIDGFLTIGVGQKIGIFAGSGVGKSTLLGMIARKSKADINVIALVGERGREVQEFIERDLGEEGLAKSVLVVATSDESQLLQIKAAKLATSIAEKFRDEGNEVLLMMDSITRFADARRTIDIANEEYPIGGKTLLMESYMKSLLERAGKVDGGSITGIYTVLVDGDDMNGVIPDLARGILDGHIILDRKLAVKGHYPAISVMDSLSRVMEAIVSEEHNKLNKKLRKVLSINAESETMVKVGVIQENEETKEIFEARRNIPKINHLLQQNVNEFEEYERTVDEMRKIVSEIKYV